MKGIILCIQESSKYIYKDMDIFTCQYQKKEHNIPCSNLIYGTWSDNTDKPIK